MTMKNFLLMLVASASDKAALQAINLNITMHVDATAKPLWFDTTHAGYFICSSLTASQIWAKALKDLPPAKTENLRDLLIVELGRDYAARPETKATAWLNSHGAVRRFG